MRVQDLESMLMMQHSQSTIFQSTNYHISKDEQTRQQDFFIKADLTKDEMDDSYKERCG